MRRLDPKGSVGNVLTTKLSRISSFRRHISLNTAIQRGLLDEDASRKHRSRGRKDQDELDEEINRPPEPHWSYRKELSPTNHPDKDFGFKAARRSQDDRRESATVHTKSSSTDSLWRRRKRDDFSHREGHRTSHGRQDVPHKLPFTTATSEFLYGRSTVIAALKARRRKFYNLYLHPRAIEGESESKETLQDLAATAHVGRVKLVNSDWLPLMDEASNDRPHNVSFPCFCDLLRLEISPLLLIIYQHHSIHRIGP
jgi:hypothetical protein